MKARMSQRHKQRMDIAEMQIKAETAREKTRRESELAKEGHTPIDPKLGSATHIGGVPPNVWQDKITGKWYARPPEKAEKERMKKGPPEGTLAKNAFDIIPTGRMLSNTEAINLIMQKLGLSHMKARSVLSSCYPYFEGFRGRMEGDINISGYYRFLKTHKISREIK